MQERLIKLEENQEEINRRRKLIAKQKFKEMKDEVFNSDGTLNDLRREITNIQITHVDSDWRVSLKNDLLNEFDKLYNNIKLRNIVDENCIVLSNKGIVSTGAERIILNGLPYNFSKDKTENEDLTDGCCIKEKPITKDDFFKGQEYWIKNSKLDQVDVSPEVFIPLNKDFIKGITLPQDFKPKITFNLKGYSEKELIDLSNNLFNEVANELIEIAKQKDYKTTSDNLKLMLNDAWKIKKDGSDFTITNSLFSKSQEILKECAMKQKIN